MEVRFEYDRCIRREIESFADRAARGCGDDVVSYSIGHGHSIEDDARDVYATFRMDDGAIDLHLRMVPERRGILDFPDARARTEVLEATRDVQDADGFHVRTEVWDDAEGRWEPFPEGPGLVVVDGGRSPR